MLNPISLRELIRRFRALGYTGPTPSGKHPYMEKGLHRVYIPNAHQGDIGVGLQKRILRRAGINVEE
ncbi:MAG: type II toxin-antitoxin system HicA family toxin [Calditrichaeota bacterium]|nr:type II toxin-antitoxin system HicA family toxin [Calditrichota bacterium]